MTRNIKDDEFMARVRRHLQSREDNAGAKDAGSSHKMPAEATGQDADATKMTAPAKSQVIEFDGAPTFDQIVELLHEFNVDLAEFRSITSGLVSVDPTYLTWTQRSEQLLDRFRLILRMVRTDFLAEIENDPAVAWNVEGSIAELFKHNWVVGVLTDLCAYAVKHHLTELYHQTLSNACEALFDLVAPLGSPAAAGVTGLQK
jgi:hypothetical protein